MKHLAILGASGHGKVVADIALASGWEKISFFDDAWPKVTQNGQWAVVGNTTELIQQSESFDGVIVAIGDCNIRWKKQQTLSNNKFKLVTLVHPMSFISPSSILGDGCVIMAGAVVNADVRIGDCCIVNSGAIIEHDCIIEYAVHIAPRAVLSGNSFVAACSWVGVGAVIKQGCKVGKNAMVGAAAVVLDVVLDNDTVVGCPAKSLIYK